LKPGRVAAAAAVLAMMTALAAPGPAQAVAAPAPPQAAAAALPMSPQARELHAWVMGARDNEGAPFVVIDKRQAQLWLFDAQGRRIGGTPVLLGAAAGDSSVPGIGERPIKEILPHERTTPAGRFIAEPGHNAQGEDILWVDYDAAVSMHRVRATNPAEQRLQRLASRTPGDNRISYGCINVPAAFYDRHLRPRFTQARGVVYLLPETLPLKALFRSEPAVRVAAAAPLLKPALQALHTPHRRQALQKTGRRVALHRPPVAATARPTATAQALHTKKPEPPTAAQARAMAQLFARPATRGPAAGAGSPGQALKTKTPRPA